MFLYGQTNENKLTILLGFGVLGEYQQSQGAQTTYEESDYKQCYYGVFKDPHTSNNTEFDSHYTIPKGSTYNNITGWICDFIGFKDESLKNYYTPLHYKICNELLYNYYSQEFTHRPFNLDDVKIDKLLNIYSQDNKYYSYADSWTTPLVSVMNFQNLMYANYIDTINPGQWLDEFIPPKKSTIIIRHTDTKSLEHIENYSYNQEEYQIYHVLANNKQNSNYIKDDQLWQYIMLFETTVKTVLSLIHKENSKEIQDKIQKNLKPYNTLDELMHYLPPVLYQKGNKPPIPLYLPPNIRLGGVISIGLCFEKRKTYDKQLVDDLSDSYKIPKTTIYKFLITLDFHYRTMMTPSGFCYPMGLNTVTKVFTINLMGFIDILGFGIMWSLPEYLHIIYAKLMDSNMPKPQKGLEILKFFFQSMCPTISLFINKFFIMVYYDFLAMAWGFKVILYINKTIGDPNQGVTKIPHINTTLENNTYTQPTLESLHIPAEYATMD